jgi:hypothetical protein
MTIAVRRPTIVVVALFIVAVPGIAQAPKPPQTRDQMADGPSLG